MNVFAHVFGRGVRVFGLQKAYTPSDSDTQR